MGYGDLIGLGFFLLVFGLGLFALSRLGAPRKPMTSEEFEKRVGEGPGILSAGVIGLQKILEPGMEKSLEVQQSLRRGRYDGEQESGAGDDKPGTANTKPQSPPKSPQS